MRVFRRRPRGHRGATPFRARLVRWSRRALGVVAVLVALVSVAWWRAGGGTAVRVGPPDMPVVREVTGLYPIAVDSIAEPTTTDQVAALVQSTTGPITIGGGRYSMGGQTATPGGLQLDLRQLKGVIAVDTVADTMRVYAGTRWRDVQEVLDPLGRAVKVMQTYNNFTVGGALSVNAHGRYIGLGPVSMTVRSLRLVLADGSIVETSRTERPELYAAALGGYGAIGVITEATLEIAKNDRIRRSWERLPLDSYPAYFDRAIAGTTASDTAVIFHNGDLAPPNYDEVGALTYRRTTAQLDDTAHLRPLDQTSAIRRAFFGGLASDWSRSFTVWARERIVDPLYWRGHPVTWRNLEASYDVSELEPKRRDHTTFVLQEYFIPQERLAPAVRALGAVLRKHDVHTVNISIRHALADTVPYLTWAPTNTFALVLYYAQETQPDDQRAVGVWTREAIDSVLAHGGRYYLPYQAHATRAQFLRAYPRASELFALKAQLDPSGRFTNTLWDVYAPVPGTDTLPTVTAARFPVQLPAEVRLALDSVPNYYRVSLAGVVAHPEWDLVWSSDALRDWVVAGGAPSGFAWMRSIGTFWRSYRAAWREATRVGEVPSGFHAMLMVIGGSTTVEYTLTGLYENTIGRVTEWLGGYETGADRVYAEQAAAYSALIHEAGWYRFDFWPYVGRVWGAAWGSGGQLVRSLERKLFLSLLWSVKAAYAQLLEWSFGAESDTPVRELVVIGRDTTRALPDGVTAQRVGIRGYERLTVGRYRPFEALLRALSADTLARVVEVNGSPTAVLTARVADGGRVPGSVRVVADYPAVPDAPSAPALRRVLITVPMPALLELLRSWASTPGVRIDHVYDY
jgi:FAD/FMN-containing dehydrogenase